MVTRVAGPTSTAAPRPTQSTAPAAAQAQTAPRGFGADEMSDGKGSALRRRAAQQLSGLAPSGLKHADRSAERALAGLKTPVSGPAMAKAILEGIKDLDSQSTRGELRTITAWAKANDALLTDEAKKVVEVYARRAELSRERGNRGFSEQEVKGLRERMADVARGEKPVEAAPKDEGGVKEDAEPKGPRALRKELYEKATRHPNQFFKRQGQHARYNPRPDEKGGYDGKNANCGPTSLAMAVKAFGLERPSFAKDKVNGIEDSIDLARNAMTLPHGKWNTTREPSSNDASTDHDDRMRGARRLGLEVSVLPHNARKPLEALDRAFDQHKMVLLNGVPGPGGRNPSAYQKAMRDAYPGYDFNSGHTILVMGRDKDGKYLVADPLSRKGVVHMNARQLASYQASSALAVWR